MKLNISLLATVLVFISGCSTVDNIIRPPVQQSSVTVIRNVPAPISVINITIIQGKTTKQQIMNQLGQPDQYTNSRQGDFMHYHVYTNNRIINVTYIEKSGSSFSYVISQAENTKKGITVGINTLNNTVGGINIH